ncbi:hypothetical protein GXP67_30045 [Rhodocytophaga rosea]|uniref:CBM20 domain-containing protein n=1 Tax=Rhodocytophaga rosea TaxID=2704465 RepID=A0A6C0GRV1_9BACT|nr:hypothetical protein [Rhodocytophaga rosea]QHT70594.1 hypothetical protein GXP67_30045 [Rhodocytophaga rosea]
MRSLLLARRYLYLFLMLMGILVSSCQKVTIVVEGIPSNTPRGAALFVSGNFNVWDPGDQSYMLNRNKDSTYSITLPRGTGKIQYKFTRGDWKTVETDGCGHELENRITQLGEEDTIYTHIMSWEDLGPINCDLVTFAVDVPAYTPEDQGVYLAGSFNNWNPGNPKYRLAKGEKGIYYIQVPRQSGTIEYKFTRGDWSREEVNEIGEPIPNRQFTYGKEDTVYVKIPAWIDIEPEFRPEVTFIVNAPRETPPNAGIYIAGTFNGWFTKDEKYRLKKTGPSQYAITLSALDRYIEFKFTRGSWATEELDENGWKISNRQFVFGRADTVVINIPHWNDIGSY